MKLITPTHSGNLVECGCVNIQQRLELDKKLRDHHD
jgi:hypothetical protein